MLKLKISFQFRLFLAIFFVLLVGFAVVFFWVGYYINIQVESNAVRLAVVSALMSSIGLALAVCLFLSLFLSQELSVPIKSLKTEAVEIAEGNFSRRIDVARYDEVGELAQAFNAVVNKVEENEDSRQKIYSEIADEVRPALSVIRGYLEALYDGDIDPDRNNIRRVYEEVLFLSHLIDDLRELSLAQAGMLDLNAEVTDLELLIDDLAISFSDLSMKRGVTLEVVSPNKLSKVLADKHWLGKALRNLVANALERTSPGGKITIRLQRTQKEIIVGVEDTGREMFAEDQSHSFNRSQLGLSLAREIIRAHGGRLEAFSSPRSSNVLRCYIPVHKSGGREEQAVTQLVQG